MGKKNKASAKDRRRFPRLSLKVKVDYKILGEMDPVFYTVYSRNVSAAGLSMCLKDNVDAGTLLDLKFLLPEEDKSINATGKVVWSDAAPDAQDPNAKSYIAGIAFVYIDDLDKKKIRKYVTERI